MKLPVNFTLCSLILFIFFLFLVFSVPISSPTHLGLVGFDRAVDLSVQNLRGVPWLAELMKTVTYAGNLEVVTVLETAILILIIFSRRKKIALFFLGSSLASEAASLTFKFLLKRPRPVETVFNITAHGYSFPSSHALIAIAFYGCLGFFLAHFSKKIWLKYLIGWLTALTVFLIGFSRVFLQVHYASDVLAGWLLGGAFFVAVIGVYVYNKMYE